MTCSPSSRTCERRRASATSCAPALEALVEPTSEEQGYVNYDLHQSLEDPDLFLFYENWESGSDLDAHLAAPHLGEFAARIPELLDEQGLTVNRVQRIA